MTELMLAGWCTTFAVLIVSGFVLAFASAAGAQDAALATTLRLPTVGVDAAIVTAPLTGTTWDVSHLGQRVGHLESTAWLDRPGNIVLGGHSEDRFGHPAVFAALFDLAIGDPVLLSRAGIEREYVVTEIQFVEFTDLRPLYPTEHEQVTLLTCAVGTFNTAIDNYDQRLIVIARPAATARRTLPFDWWLRLMP